MRRFNIARRQACVHCQRWHWPPRGKVWAWDFWEESSFAIPVTTCLCLVPSGRSSSSGIPAQGREKVWLKFWLIHICTPRMTEACWHSVPWTPWPGCYLLLHLLQRLLPWFSSISPQPKTFEFLVSTLGPGTGRRSGAGPFNPAQWLLTGIFSMRWSNYTVCSLHARPMKHRHADGVNNDSPPFFFSNNIMTTYPPCQWTLVWGIFWIQGRKLYQH